MADQDTHPASDPVFSCDVCGKTCLNQNALTKHKKTARVHEGLRRNENNKSEIDCNVCDKVFNSRKGLYQHQQAIHRANVDAPAESTEDDTETTTTKVEDVYEGDGLVRNGLSREKECVVEILTSMASGNIQDSVKRAFRNLVMK